MSRWRAPVQVGDVSVVKAAHEHVVNLIKTAGDILVLKVVHVPAPPQQLMPTVTGKKSKK